MNCIRMMRGQHQVNVVPTVQGISQLFPFARNSTRRWSCANLISSYNNEIRRTLREQGLETRLDVNTFRFRNTGKQVLVRAELNAVPT